MPRPHPVPPGTGDSDDSTGPGLHSRLHLDLHAGVHLDQDPRTDPTRALTGQDSVAVSDPARDATFPSRDFAQERLRTLTCIGVLDRFRPLKPDDGSYPYYCVLAQLGRKVVTAQRGDDLPRRRSFLLDLHPTVPLPVLVDLRLRPDTRPDPWNRLTDQVNGAVSHSDNAATDPQVWVFPRVAPPAGVAHG